MENETLRYCVITHEGNGDGGCSDEIAFPYEINFEISPKRPRYTTKSDYNEMAKKSDPMEWVQLRVPVFCLGELLVLNDCGREVNGHQRKPSKWGIGYEVYDDFATALRRAIVVSSAYPTVPPPETTPRQSQTIEELERAQNAMGATDAH